MQYINLRLSGRLSGLKRMEASKTLASSIGKGDYQAHFGWEFHIKKKDVYYDGHERPDVIKYI